MPACRSCHEFAEPGEAVGWIALYKLRGRDEQSLALGRYCTAACAAAALFALDPWSST